MSAEKNSIRFIRVFACGQWKLRTVRDGDKELSVISVRELEDL